MTTRTGSPSAVEPDDYRHAALIEPPAHRLGVHRGTPLPVRARRRGAPGGADALRRTRRWPSWRPRCGARRPTTCCTSISGSSGWRRRRRRPASGSSPRWTPVDRRAGGLHATRRRDRPGRGRDPAGATAALRAAWLERATARLKARACPAGRDGAVRARTGERGGPMTSPGCTASSRWCPRSEAARHVVAPAMTLRSAERWPSGRRWTRSRIPRSRPSAWSSWA